MLRPKVHVCSPILVRRRFRKVECAAPDDDLGAAASGLSCPIPATDFHSIQSRLNHCSVAIASLSATDAVQSGLTIWYGTIDIPGKSDPQRLIHPPGASLSRTKKQGNNHPSMSLTSAVPHVATSLRTIMLL